MTNHPRSLGAQILRFVYNDERIGRTDPRPDNRSFHQTCRACTSCIVVLLGRISVAKISGKRSPAPAESPCEAIQSRCLELTADPFNLAEPRIESPPGAMHISQRQYALVRGWWMTLDLLCETCHQAVSLSCPCWTLEGGYRHGTNTIRVTSPSRTILK